MREIALHFTTTRPTFPSLSLATGYMAGFADIDDLDFLTRSEIAARLGYASAATARRALARLGVGWPPCPFRGRARGDVVKAWAADLPADASTFPQAGRPASDAGGQPAAARPTGRPQRPANVSERNSREGLNVKSLEEARARLRARAEAL